jgi:ribonuclease G
MEILVLRQEEKIFSVLAEEKKVIQIHVEKDMFEKKEQEPPRVGDIYVGKVRNVVKNINAAFVEFFPGQMGYLPLTEKVSPLHTDTRKFQENRVLIGDEIIVQIKREASKTKPPTLTGAFDITGRYGVLSYGLHDIRISKKIQDKEKREQLKHFFQEYSHDSYGFIARTNCERVGEEVLRAEISTLVKRYEDIIRYGVHRTALSRLEAAPAAFLSDIRDGYDAHIQKIIAGDETLFSCIRDYLKQQMPEELPKLCLWNEPYAKADAVYQVSRHVKLALQQKVWLKNGAYLVIQPTEALVSIDVNTGKAISKKKDVQKNFFKVNQEAAKEIAYQLRLRNLSGIILVDFIDMASSEDNAALLELLRREVKKDSVQTTVVDMTKLGLVEITRKKIKKSLFEMMRDASAGKE